MHQKTTWQNLGMRGPKNRSLTAVAYSSGISSSVALLTSSREHKVHWDFVSKSVADMVEYSKFSKKDKELTDEAAQYMSACKLVAGKDWDEIAEDEGRFKDGNTGMTDYCLHNLVLRDQGVVPLTMAQLCNAWWLLRASCMNFSYEDYLNFDHLFAILVYF